MNRWNYVEGNPINGVDPSGLWWCRPTPGCEPWVFAASDRLRSAGPQSQHVMVLFDDWDHRLLGIGIYFTGSGAGARTPALLDEIYLPQSWLNDTTGTQGFDQHVALFAHEIVHVVTFPHLGSTRREVEAYIIQGLVMGELKLAIPRFIEQITTIGWDPVRNDVTDSFEKLCQARELLLSDLFTSGLHDVYSQQPLMYWGLGGVIPVTALVCSC